MGRSRVQRQIPAPENNSPIKKPLTIIDDERLEFGGRPTDYNEKLAELICERVATHPWGIKRICQHYGDLPAPSTIALWKTKHKEFSERYMIAKRESMHLLAEANQHLTANVIKTSSWIDEETGALKVDPGMVALASLELRANQWTMARLMPQVYGDKNKDTVEVDKTLLEKLLEKK